MSTSLVHLKFIKLSIRPRVLRDLKTRLGVACYAMVRKIKSNLTILSGKRTRMKKYIANYALIK